MTPLRSHMMTWAGRTPIDLISSVQAMAAAPAPLTTTLTFLSLRPVRWQALMMPAAVMIAVRCWSSWKTGMFIRSRSSCSMMKQDGAAISSRLMPPKLLHQRDGVDEAVGILGGELDIDRIDVGEAFEQHRLAFHHRLGGERAEVAEAEAGRPVGDNGDEIALGRIVIGGGRTVGPGPVRVGDSSD